MAVRIEFEFHHQQFTAALERMNVTPARRTALLRAIGVGLRDTTQHRFTTATTPVGSHWQTLSPAYAALKTAMGRTTGILIGAGMRGGLQGSISMSTSGDSVIVGSNKVYAAIHQFGGVIKPKTAKGLAFPLMLGGHAFFIHAKSVRIPPRPYLGFGHADELVVLDAIDVLLPGGR